MNEQPVGIWSVYFKNSIKNEEKENQITLDKLNFCGQWSLTTLGSAIETNDSDLSSKCKQWHVKSWLWRFGVHFNTGDPKFENW